MKRVYITEEYRTVPAAERVSIDVPDDTQVIAFRLESTGLKADTWKFTVAQEVQLPEA